MKKPELERDRRELEGKIVQAVEAAAATAAILIA